MNPISGTQIHVAVEPSTEAWSGAASLKKTVFLETTNDQELLSKVWSLVSPSLLQAGMVVNCHVLAVTATENSWVWCPSMPRKQCPPQLLALTIICPFFLYVPWALGDEAVIQISHFGQSTVQTLALCSLTSYELSLFLILTSAQNSFWELNIFIIDYIYLLSNFHNSGFFQIVLHITRLVSLNHSWIATISHTQNHL